MACSVKPDSGCRRNDGVLPLWHTVALLDIEFLPAPRRTPDWPALYPRQTPQSLYLLYLADLDDRHRARHRGADRGVVGDERLSKGTAHTHSRRRLACRECVCAVPFESRSSPT